MREMVYDKDEFLNIVENRKHWYISEIGPITGPIELLLSGLDKQGNLVKYVKCIGSVCFGGFTKRTKSWNGLMKETKEIVGSLPHDFTEGIWKRK